jgi:hypothetical protein
MSVASARRCMQQIDEDAFSLVATWRIKRLLMLILILMIAC